MCHINPASKAQTDSYALFRLHFETTRNPKTDKKLFHKLWILQLFSHHINKHKILCVSFSLYHCSKSISSMNSLFDFPIKKRKGKMRAPCKKTIKFVTCVNKEFITDTTSVPFEYEIESEWRTNAITQTLHLFCATDLNRLVSSICRTDANNRNWNKFSEWKWTILLDVDFLRINFGSLRERDRETGNRTEKFSIRWQFAEDERDADTTNIWIFNFRIVLCTKTVSFEWFSHVCKFSDVQKTREIVNHVCQMQKTSFQLNSLRWNILQLYFVCICIHVCVCAGFRRFNVNAVFSQQNFLIYFFIVLEKCRRAVDASQ